MAERDLAGYGGKPPHPRWPGDARVALQFVLNVEEGAESCVLNGDPQSEAYLHELPGRPARGGERDLSVEGLYEYGSRAGIWRILDLFAERGLPLTAFAVGRALELVPQIGHALRAGGHEVAGHGYRWLDYREIPEDEERRHIRLVDTPGDEAAMHEVYAKAARDLQTGQLDRTARTWRKSWGDPDQAAVIYIGEGGDPEGYCIVRYRADLPVNTRFLEVEERAWLTLGAQKGIYAWLSTLGDQWREIVYRAHPEEGFGDRISEPRLPLLAAPGWRLWFPSATLLRGPMFRILDVADALRMRTLATDVELTLKLVVDDPQVPENQGPWTVRMEGGAMHVQPYGGERCDAEFRVPMDTLSRIFIGALAVWQAISGGLGAIGHETIDREEIVRRLDQALLVPKPWTFDKF